MKEKERERDWGMKEREIDVNDMAKKLGVSKPLLEDYVKTFGIKNEEELIKRLANQGYAKIWPKSVFGKLAYQFRTNEGLIKAIMNETEEKEKLRYASAIEGAMLFELSAHKKGLDDEKIKNGLEKLASTRIDFQETFYNKEKQKTEKVSIRLSALEFIGLCYDGFEAIGTEEKWVKYASQEAIKKYQKDAIELINLAVFNEKNEVRDGKELFDSLAIAGVSLYKGYAELLVRKDEYGKTEENKMVTFYNEMKQKINEFSSYLKKLVEKGELEKKYYEMFLKEHSLYAAVYAHSYNFYSAILASINFLEEKKLDEKTKEELRKEMEKSLGFFYQKASDESIRDLVENYANTIKLERLRFRSSKDRETFSLTLMRYDNRIKELRAFLSPYEYFELLNSLTSKNWEDKWKENYFGGKNYENYLQNVIKEKWQENVFSKIKDELEKQRSIKLNENDEKMAIKLLFYYGYSIDDIVFIATKNVKYEKVIEEFEKLKNDKEIENKVRALMKEANIEEKYLPVVLEPILRRAALINILNNELKENERVNVYEALDKFDIKSYNELIKQQELEKMPKERQEQVKILYFISEMQKSLPIRYLEKTGEESKELKQIETMDKEEIREAYYIIDPKRLGRGYEVTFNKELSQKVLGYLPSAYWIINNKKYGGKIKSTDDLHSFIINRYFGAAKGESAEIVKKRFESVRNYFLNNYEAITGFMSLEELSNLEESAKIVMENLNIGANEQNKRKVMVLLFSIQAVEMPYEIFGKGKTFEEKWIDGWKKATKGITVNKEILKQKTTNLEERIKNLKLKDGVYYLSLTNENGIKADVYKVSISKNGKEVKISVLADKVEITKDDRFVLTDGSKRNIIAGSNGSTAVFLLAANKDALTETYKPIHDEAWRKQFVINGNIEIGYGSCSAYAGTIIIKTKEKEGPKGLAPLMKPKPSAEVKTYNMIDYVGAPIALKEKAKDVYSLILPIIPVLRVPTTETIITEEIVKKTEEVEETTVEYQTKIVEETRIEKVPIKATITKPSTIEAEFPPMEGGHISGENIQDALKKANVYFKVENNRIIPVDENGNEIKRGDLINKLKDAGLNEDDANTFADYVYNKNHVAERDEKGKVKSVIIGEEGKNIKVTLEGGETKEIVVGEEEREVKETKEVKEPVEKKEKKKVEKEEKVKKEEKRELTERERQKMLAEMLRNSFVVGMVYREGAFAFAPQVMFLNGQFINPSLAISTNVPLINYENIGLISNLGTNISPHGLGAVVGLTPYVQLNNLQLNLYGGLSIPSAVPYYGVGASYVVEGAIFSASATRSSIAGLPVNVFSFGTELERFGLLGVNVYNVGPYFIPVPTLLTRAAERPIKKFFESTGLRTPDAEAWNAIGLQRKPEDIYKSLIEFQEKQE